MQFFNRFKHSVAVSGVLLFLLAPAAYAAVCDVNNDSVIDRTDIQLIAGGVGATIAQGDPRDADLNGQITINDTRACTLRCTRPKCSTTNSAPVANAGADQTTQAGQAVSLNGSGSSDPDGDALTFEWTLITTPSGSAAVLANASTASPSFVTDRAGSYVAQLVVRDRQAVSAPDLIVVSTDNSAPVANAGVNQTVLLNATVTLDGTGSTDVDGDPLIYQWTFKSKPVGSAANLSLATTAKPTFFADKPGSYVAQLVVHDGKIASAAASVTITTSNTTPVANAGPDQSAFVTQSVTVNGGASTDVDGDTLTHIWSLTSKPAGSTAQLSDVNAVSPTFVADVAGAYIVQLVVNDGKALSAPDTVVVTTQNSQPKASAGANRTGPVGSTVTLDGSGSTDVDGDALSYRWSLLSRPTGSAVQLSNVSTVRPTFVIDKAGSYVAQLIVNDGSIDSDPVTVTITTANTAPVANAGPDQTVPLTATVTLNGAGSNDVDGQALTYSWALISKPLGSVAALSSVSIVTSTFVADKAGVYVVQLLVNDGFVSSTIDTVQISTTNSTPVASAGPDQTVDANTTVFLNGSSSSDADGEALSFRWSILSGPTANPPALNNPTTFNPNFVATTAGDFVIQLIVNDGKVNSAPDTMLVTVRSVNRPPIANAGAGQTVAVGGSVVLTGAASSDPDGDALTYNWSFVSRPAGSTAALTGTTGISTGFVAGVGGAYIVQLIVSDGKVSSAPVTVTITAKANAAPIANGDSYSVEQGAALSVIAPGVLANDSDPDGDSLVAELVSGATGGAVNLQANGGFSYAPRPAFSGVDKFSYRASDGQATSAPAGVTVNVKPDVTVLPLDVDLTVAPQFVASGGSVTITVVPKGGVGAIARTLQVDGAAVTLDGSGKATIAGAPIGVHRVVATVSDENGSATKESFFGVTNSSDTAPGVAAITSPTDSADVFGVVNIVGTASDANLALYQLLVSPAGAGQFTEFARGASSITNGVLGRFDSTGLANGFYDVLLRVIDVNGRESLASLTLQVIGDQKVGNFQVTFEDLNVEASGIPIIVTRTYSTARKNERLDFGYGWSVDYQNVKIQNNKVVGRDWQLTSTGSILRTWCVRPVGKRTVSITLPDGKVERFDFSVSPECQAITPPQTVTPVFTARAGTRSKLTTSDPGLLVQGLTVYDTGTGDAFDPTDFTLTTEEGFVYQLDKNFGIRSVRDLSGNTLTYSTNGITHSAGKSVAFQRDGQGRITRITDPNGKVINYSYNDNGDLATVTDRDNQTAEHRYNRSHGLVDFTDPRGVLLMRNVYDDNGKLIEQIDAAGNKVELTHDIPGQRETVKDRRGFSTVYEYDASGNVTRQVDALGGVTAYTYDARGNELSVTDPLGQTTTRVFDANDRITTERDTLGNTIAYTYNTSGQTTQVIDARGNKTDLSYSLSGNLTQTKDATGAATNFSYDSKGNLTQITDALGQVTRYTYDTAGRKTEEHDPLGSVTRYTYDANGKETSRSTSRTTSSGVVDLTTTRVLDGNGRVVEESDVTGAKETTTYNSLGKVATRTDKRGNTTSYLYDARGHLIKTAYPDGTNDTTDYDANGNEIAKIDRAARVTQFQYDAANRLIKTIYPNGSEIANTYDAAGRIVAATNEGGHAATYEYDAAGRRTKVTDAIGNVTRTSYDANGNVAAVTDALGRVTSYTYNGASRRTKTTFDDGTTIEVQYDVTGRKAQEADQAGIITRFAYDPLNRLAQVTDPLGGLTRYTYDELSNKLTQTDALGRVTRWEYDPLGRTTKRILPAGQSESFTYDAVGNIATHTDFNGITTAFQYDSNNQVSRKIFADGSNIAYSYTATGKIAGVTDARGLTRHIYDARDRLAQVENPDGSVLSYSYDAMGNRSEMVVTQGSNPSRTIRYTYDVLNRLTTVVDPEGGTTTYGYDAVGNRVSIDYPNGTRATYTYNRLNRLTQLTHTQGSGLALARFDYTLASNGQRVRAEETVNGATRTVDYTYDASQRLMRELITDLANGNRDAAYVYDAVGNRLAQTVNGAATHYTYDNNDRLLTEVSTGGIFTYGYDANGNTLSKSNGGATLAIYTYNLENRLTRGQDGGATTFFAYDADGVRVTKSAGSAVTQFIVDKNQKYAQVVEERNGAGNLIVGYLHGDDLIKQFRNGQGTFYHADGLGSVRLLTGATGAVSDTYHYEAFGTLLSSTGGTPNNYLYTGEQYDPNLGFYYLRARYLNPAIGRFISLDSFAGFAFDPASLHKYTYVHNNPVNNLDPSGQMLAGFVGGLNAGIGQALAAVRVSFGISRSLGGLALRNLGALLENQVAATLARVLPAGAVAQRNIPLVGDGGRRVLDFWVQVGNRVAAIEVKFNLPRAGSDAFVRLVGQVRTYATAEEAVRANAQVVLFTYNAPSAAQMTALLTELGPTAGNVQFVNGLMGLTHWVRLFFLPI